MVACYIGGPVRGALSSGSVAHGLSPGERQGLSIAVLSGAGPVTELARDLGVSRKFCYQQAQKGREALTEAFKPAEPGKEVLFHLPVTPQWIEQFVLGQLLIGHSSMRGVLELLRTLLDFGDMSLGGICRIVQRAVAKARECSRGQDAALLGAIKAGAHDEIYQGRKPVLVGVDVDSTYCYLLQEAEHCDETTWGVRLLELSEAGLALDHTIADAGLGLRAGQKAAWPGVPCRGDVFHAERDLGRVAAFLQNREAATCKAVRTLEERLQRRVKPAKVAELNGRLEAARREHARARDLARDVTVLWQWLGRDVLALAGESLAVREEMFDFITAELGRLEPQCPHRIEPVRRGLCRQRDSLLAFAGALDQELAQIARGLGVPGQAVRAVCRLAAMDPKQAAYWQFREQLYRGLGKAFYALESAVGQALAATTRASSVVENLNSRLRCYFFLRRAAGQGYLDLLRFFLNHHRFCRSAQPRRVGRSPAEILADAPQPHWLEQLGYQLFRRAG